MRDGRTPGELLRFLAVGGVNTLLTYLLLLALTYVVDPRAAYTIAFCVGVVGSALLTGPLVFRSRPSTRHRVLYAGWLGMVYLFGLATLQLAILAGMRSEPLLAALPLLVTAPLTFIGGRSLLVGSSVQLRPEEGQTR